jgi:hypothetical protein
MTSVSEGSSTRWVVVPDTQGDLTHTLATLEEVLLLLQPIDDSEVALPNVGPDELHALQDICLRLLAAERFGGPQLYAPDGKFEYVPLFFFQLLEEDLAAVGRAIAEFGSALLPGGDSEMHEALRGFLQGRQTCQDLVVRFAQAHGVLDLEPDEDSRFLLETLVREQGRVVLSHEQHEAYRRYTGRFLELHFNDALDRFLFRGP